MDIKFVQSPNYKKGRGKSTITHVVIHTMQGFYAGTIQWFQNFKSQVSAHYCVSKKGEVTQMVKEEDRAFHVCNANPFTVGIELEDASWGKDKNGKNIVKNSQTDPSWFTLIELDATAELAADICKRNEIPVKNIIGHNDPLLKSYGNNHQDPGPWFPWTKFRAMVQQKLDSTMVLAACA